MSKLTLYDIPSKAGVCWSFNPWKTRLALNFKDIDYTTAWTEYLSIEPTLKPHVPPNTDGRPYTSPAVQLPTGDYIMNSKSIVIQLEKTYPEPSLHLDSPALKLVETLLPGIWAPLAGVWMPRIPDILNEDSSEYFARTRAQWKGKSLEQFGKEEGGEEAWMATTPGIKAIGKVLKKNGGPFVLAETVSYADFVIVSFLEFLKVVDQEFFDRIVKVEPAFGKLYEACEPWLKRNSY